MQDVAHASTMIGIEIARMRRLVDDLLVLAKSDETSSSEPAL
jgi:signal transduction histidine kinase